MTEEEQTIRNQDYSHPYTTSLDHVLALYNTILDHKLERICELGSYKGISTIALAYGAKANAGFVCAVDLCDEIDNKQRVACWQTVQPPVMRYIFPIKNSSKNFLENCDSQFDFIYHDSKHGNEIIPELDLAWHRLPIGGMLAVHDYEQIADRNFKISIEKNAADILTDDRGRQLAIFKKTW